MIKHNLLQSINTIKNRGFTIVELLIVIAVISILSTVAIYNYINVRKQSVDANIAANSAWVGRQLEQYKTTHGEYPTMEALNPGTSATDTVMTDFSAAATILGINTTFLSGPDTIKFHAMCASGCTVNPQKTQYEYVALNAAANTAGIPYTWNAASIGCTVTIDYADPSFVMVYFNSFKNVWIFKRSPRGTATIANYGSGPTAPQTCTFTL